MLLDKTEPHLSVGRRDWGRASALRPQAKKDPKRKDWGQEPALRGGSDLQVMGSVQGHLASPRWQRGEREGNLSFRPSKKVKVLAEFPSLRLWGRKNQGYRHTQSIPGPPTTQPTI